MSNTDNQIDHNARLAKVACEIWGHLSEGLGHEHVDLADVAAAQALLDTLFDLIGEERARLVHRQLAEALKPKGKPMAKESPVFQAEWSDNITTRMSTYCPDDELNLARAVRLSAHAHDSRTKGRSPDARIVKGHFERNGEVLQRYENIDPRDYALERNPSSASKTKKGKPS
jgi:hypothetical protein